MKTRPYRINDRDEADWYWFHWCNQHRLPEPGSELWEFLHHVDDLGSNLYYLDSLLQSARTPTIEPYRILSSSIFQTNSGHRFERIQAAELQVLLEENIRDYLERETFVERVWQLDLWRDYLSYNGNNLEHDTLGSPLHRATNYRCRRLCSRQARALQSSLPVRKFSSFGFLCLERWGCFLGRLWAAFARCGIWFKLGMEKRGVWWAVTWFARAGDRTGSEE